MRVAIIGMAARGIRAFDLAQAVLSVSRGRIERNPWNLNRLKPAEGARRSSPIPAIVHSAFHENSHD
jgi:hypothetical protein